MRRAIDGLLRAVLPDGPGADAIRGDLREEYERRRAAGRRALSWYAVQAVGVAGWSVMDRLRGRPWIERRAEEATRPTGGRRAAGDVSDGLRVLRRSPGYSAAVVATLGLALATTVTVFTLVRGVLLRDLPYPDPDSLVRIDRIQDGEIGTGSISYPDLSDWRERIGSLYGIAAHTGYEGLYVSEGVAEIWRGAAVTGNLLEVLRVSPALGPGFDVETGAVGARSIVFFARPVAAAIQCGPIGCRNGGSVRRRDVADRRRSAGGLGLS